MLKVLYIRLIINSSRAKKGRELSRQIREEEVTFTSLTHDRTCWLANLSKNAGYRHDSVTGIPSTRMAPSREVNAPPAGL